MFQKHKGFVIIYLIWTFCNILVMSLAMRNVFGVSDNTMAELWPFTVSSLRYYDFYELAVLVGIPFFMFIVYQKGKSKWFWTFYIIWGIIDLSMMIAARSQIFILPGELFKTYWPIPVGDKEYYDLMALAIYLLIPLVIYYLYRLVHLSQMRSEEDGRE